MPLESAPLLCFIAWSNKIYNSCTSETMGSFFLLHGFWTFKVLNVMWQKLSSKERVAAQLRLSEKTILSNTMTALRNRLAPIRGIPTKGGGLKVCICGSETCIVNFTCLFSEWMFDLWLFKPFLDLFSFSLLFRIRFPLFLQLYLTWTCVVLICNFVYKRYYVFFLSFILQFSLSWILQ